MWTSSLGVALLVGACYAPVAQPGAPCAGDDRCPIGQRCVSGACAGTASEDGDTCLTAIKLGTISGDTLNQTITATGYAGAWFRVRVTENSDEVVGRALRVAATLTVPASVDLDVRVYVNVDVDEIECATAVGTASTTGNVKQVRAAWGEGLVANGVNDGRDASIELRSIAGAAAEPWQLVVEGNWN